MTRSLANLAYNPLGSLGLMVLIVVVANVLSALLFITLMVVVILRGGDPLLLSTDLTAFFEVAFGDLVWLGLPLVFGALILFLHGTILLTIVLLRRFLPDTTWADLGVTRHRFWRNLLWGLGVTAVLFAFVIAAGYLASLGDTEVENDPLLGFDFANNPLTWVILILTIGVFGPFVEELFFRGVVVLRGKRYLESIGFPHPKATILIFSSAFFAIIHIVPIVMIPIFFAGLIYGWITLHTKSIVAATLAHMLNNTVAVIGLLWALG